MIEFLGGVYGKQKRINKMNEEELKKTLMDIRHNCLIEDGWRSIHDLDSNTILDIVILKEGIYKFHTTEKPLYLKALQNEDDVYWKYLDQKEKDFYILTNLTNEALELAFDDKSFDEPINWGDLGCVRVLKCIDIKGASNWQVYIEEASPDCGELKDFVASHLFKNGYKDVEVFTEW